MIKTWLVGLTLSLLFAGCHSSATTGRDALLLGPRYHSKLSDKTCCLVIAHAGGGIDGNSYTNSIEALTQNYEMGTRVFELDFEKTADGQWVVLHDWNQWQRLTHAESANPPTLKVFKSRKLIPPTTPLGLRGEYSPMDLEDLVAFLKSHADARIVTDTKGDFRGLVDAVLASKEAGSFIFQAYAFGDIDYIRSKSRNARIILTLYKMGMPSIDDFLRQLESRRKDLIGLTLPLAFLREPGRLTKLRSADLPIYVHGAPQEINSRQLHYELGKQGVSGFYLD